MRISTGVQTCALPISLLSSRHLRFVHDGASFGRVEKTTAIAAAGDPLKLLRVCGESKRHDNCSRCSKCLRTMEIGRASCRERVCQYVSISVVAVSLKNKHEYT